MDWASVRSSSACSRRRASSSSDSVLARLELRLLDLAARRGADSRPDVRPRPRDVAAPRSRTRVRASCRSGRARRPPRRSPRRTHRATRAANRHRATIALRAVRADSRAVRPTSASTAAVVAASVDPRARASRRRHLASEHEQAVVGVDAVRVEQRCDGARWRRRRTRLPPSLCRRRVRTTSALARSPNSSASAPTMMDFPAPVSPVSTLKPGASGSVTRLDDREVAMRSSVSTCRLSSRSA